MKKFFTIAALATALIVCGCDNPAGDDTAENTGNNPAGAEPRIEAVEGFFSEEAVPGALAATFTFPQYGGPWAAALVSGENSAHNNKFVVSENTLRIGGAALAAGTYKVRVRVTGGAYKEETALVFPVTNTPVAFAKPPKITQFFMTAQKKITVEWDKRPGAAGYKVYLGTTANAADTALAYTVSGGDTKSADITGLPNEGGPVQNAVYAIWVRAFNGSGETGLSPVAQTVAADPIGETLAGEWQSMFGETYLIDRDAMTLSYGFVYNGTADYGFWGTIMHHQDFGVETHRSPGNGFPNGEITGKSGVFVIKFDEGSSGYGTRSDYYAVYYYGLGAVVPANAAAEYGPGRKVTHFANAWRVKEAPNQPADGFQHCPPTPTFYLSDAIALFTKENMDMFVGWSIVYPQLKVEDQGTD